MINNFFIFFIIFTSALIFFCRKFNVLIDQKIEKHKKYSTKNKSFLIGGILVTSFLNYYYLFVKQNPILCLFISLVFVIGLSSDLRKINSVSLRFFLQCVIVLLFVNFLNIKISYTRIDIFDQWLSIPLVNIIFVAFCLLVLINGSNFIDGINGLTIGYFLLIFSIIFLNSYHLDYDKNLLENLIIILLIILLLNLKGILYLGDSGSYTIGLFAGIFLIDFAFNNTSLSPYFIIVLLWYPCFELLFSIIRRFFKKLKTYNPDITHLHHLIYKKIKTYFKIKNDSISHFISSLIINFYNLLCFCISIKYIYSSATLIIIFLINIFVYIISYNYLKKII